MFSPGLLSTKTNPRLASRVNGVLFQLPVSPGEFSHSDNSNHAMSLGLSQYRAGVCGGHDNLPISDNNVSTTNDALEAGEWDVPETEADLDVSILSLLSLESAGPTD